MLCRLWNKATISWSHDDSDLLSQPVLTVCDTLWSWLVHWMVYILNKCITLTAANACVIWYTVWMETSQYSKSSKCLEMCVIYSHSLSSNFPTRLALFWRSRHPSASLCSRVLLIKLTAGLTVLSCRAAFIANQSWYFIARTLLYFWTLFHRTRVII